MEWKWILAIVIMLGFGVTFVILYFTKSSACDTSSTTSDPKNHVHPDPNPAVSLDHSDLRTQLEQWLAHAASQTAREPVFSARQGEFSSPHEETAEGPTEEESKVPLRFDGYPVKVYAIERHVSSRSHVTEELRRLGAWQAERVTISAPSSDMSQVAASTPLSAFGTSLMSAHLSCLAQAVNQHAHVLMLEDNVKCVSREHLERGFAQINAVSSSRWDVIQWSQATVRYQAVSDNETVWRLQEDSAVNAYLVHADYVRRLAEKLAGSLYSQVAVDWWQHLGVQTRDMWFGLSQPLAQPSAVEAATEVFPEWKSQHVLMVQMVLDPNDTVVDVAPLWCRGHQLTSIVLGFQPLPKLASYHRFQQVPTEHFSPWRRFHHLQSLELERYDCVFYLSAKSPLAFNPDQVNSMWTTSGNLIASKDADDNWLPTFLAGRPETVRAALPHVRAYLEQNFNVETLIV